MSRVTIRVCGAVILCGSLAATMLARADDRSADAILKEIVAITLPEADLSRVADKLYLRQFMKQRSEIRVRRAELIGALYRADPDNPRLVTLLPVRWRSLSGRLGGPDDNNEISWPQYYQGNGGESDFSRGLGINSIPTVFLVDQKGKLFSLDAGDKLETLIPELMSRIETNDDRAEGR
jgi:hypothetical protein